MGRQPLPTDTILGAGSDQYRIDTVIGPGGFGITYLARDLRFDRDVAVKEYFPVEFAYREGTTTIRSATHGAASDYFAQGKRHFLEEARTLGKFRHPHIVRVLNLVEQFNTAYMVLEFEEGQSLKSWLKVLGRRPTQAEVDRILEPMLSALELIHAGGMFHRDIAPDNIIIRPDGQPVLIDFGAARHFVRETSHTLAAIVKHGYSPPEQYTLDTKLQGAWSDIYALSATLYLAVVGEVPVEAAKRHLADTMLPIRDRLEPGVERQYRQDFLDGLEAGLALRPKDRPATIVEWRGILEGRSTGPREPATVGRPLRRIDRVQASAAEAAALGDVGRSAHPSAKAPGTAAAAARLQLLASASAPEPSVLVAVAYPEVASRVAGLVALAVGVLAAAAFLGIGGIEHPGGLAAAAVACAGLVATGLERAMAIAKAAPIDVRRSAGAAAVMSSLAFAVYWLALFLWPISVILAGAAILFSVGSFGRWVPATLMTFAVLHLVAAGLMLLLASQSEQKDPIFLPLMGASLAILASLVAISAFNMQRRWEPAL